MQRTRGSEGMACMEPSNVDFAKTWERAFYSDDDFTLLIPDEYLAVFLGPLEPAPDRDQCRTQWHDYCHGSMFGVGRPSSTERRVRDKPRLSFEFQVKVCEKYARVQVSRSHAGQAWSVTVRWSPPEAWSGMGRKQIASDYKRRAEAALDDSPWKPSKKYHLPNNSPVLFSFADIVGVTANLVFDDSHGRHGLILVTGRTGSGKSQVARGLVWQAMRDKALRDASRRPHLVTYEDPIEEFFVDVDRILRSRDVKVIEQDRAIDYTPRQKFRDCEGLEEVTTGALRQTPTALYVGEIRTNEEFAEAMEFAGTGHLVVATAHAGNLVESVGKVLDAIGSRDAGSRAKYVPRILAVVHMARVTCRIAIPGQEELKLSGLVPAVYRRTTRGVQNLVADGLFSLIPGFSRSETEAQAMGSLGRQYLAGALCNEVSTRLSKASSAEVTSRLATGFERERWQEITDWNRGRENTRGWSGKRLVDAALESDIYGQ